ncbi:transcription activator protein [Okra yellow mosaic Mexico virus]|uniref:Transcriptional activator protein n=2 Tax=Okra yellow mosaic Mexico virus TaxID=327280 RepID=Q4ZGG2_9GEMI|nr:transcription activator protein [Okra yellow mosaic Mexico virus]ABR92624.1 transcription activator protein [Okra yellow mosaic Mexico virus - Santa Teresa 2]AAY27081.1 transcription activator protein [Okra yellow mosaic Mexico virus]ADH10352.1 transcription activator protein [Okra yellow mosaic Mexico virus]ADR72667.1 transcription activator protein [Okra yellow mosaic Mexico virus]ADR72672.1 transcription activator protein [Okra yellow mosaic Mexico virus]
MRSSSPSHPPSIKTAHRQAKRRAIRRRRIDLECGCSIYLHIGCTGHGFTHRGTHHCTSEREWRLYLGDRKSPVFQDVPSRRSTIHEDQSIPRTNTVQPQPEESVASPQGLPELPSLDDIDDSFWVDLFS